VPRTLTIQILPINKSYEVHLRVTLNEYVLSTLKHSKINLHSTLYSFTCLRPSSHYAERIWKRRFHSENEIFFFPSTLGWENLTTPPPVAVLSNTRANTLLEYFSPILSFIQVKRNTFVSLLFQFQQQEVLKSKTVLLLHSILCFTHHFEKYKS